MNYRFVYDWDTKPLLGYTSLNSNGITEQNYTDIRIKAPRLKNFENFYSPIPTDLIIPRSALHSNEKYIYCIQVNNHRGYFIPKYADNIEIPDQIRADILSRRAFVLVQYVFEGMLYLNDYERFCNIITQLELPKKSVAVLHGDFITEKFENPAFTYEPYDIFSNWIPEQNQLIDYVPQKLYVTYNRNPRLHRIILIANLIKNNLINSGIVSLGQYKHNARWFQHHDHSLTADDCDSLSAYSNISPDNLNLEQENPANTVNLDHHRHSFVSLVSETLVENTVSFFSEKIYKPLSIGHPFILLGNPGSLARLHRLGFQTFSKYWDESYDLEQNWVTRIHRIIRILEQLNRLSDQERIQIRRDMYSILDHNRKTFNHLKTITAGNHELNKIFDRYLT